MKTRIMFFTGPGDAVSDYKKWKSGQRTESETSLTLTSHIYDFIRSENIKAWCISRNQNRAVIKDAQFIVENRPKLNISRHGLGYHLSQILYALNLTLSILSFKPKYIIVDSGTTHWFCLVLARLVCPNIIADFHNVYYPVGHPPQTILKKFIYFLDKVFFEHCTDCALGVSEECKRQFLELSGAGKSFYLYHYQFDKIEFEAANLPNWPSAKFRILFAGRITKNKGVFDLLLIASELKKITKIPFLIEICGTGPDLDELKSKIKEMNLEDLVLTYGYLNRVDLLSKFSESHLVIVPTRADFTEGFAKSCIEAILCNRPVITSRLTNSTKLLSPAAIEVNEEDIKDYVTKIELLMTDVELYHSLVASCAKFKVLFTSDKYSLKTAMSQVLNAKSDQS